MAKTPDDRTKMTQSKLGRGLGSLIPVSIQRPAASASLVTSEMSSPESSEPVANAKATETIHPTLRGANGTVEPRPSQTVLHADASPAQLADGMVTFIASFSPSRFQLLTILP